MYQTVGHQAIELYAEALDLPLYRRTIQGSSLDTSKNYTKTDGDEVEDLYELLHLVKVGTVCKYGLRTSQVLCLLAFVFQNVIFAHTASHLDKRDWILFTIVTIHYNYVNSPLLYFIVFLRKSSHHFDSLPPLTYPWVLFTEQAVRVLQNFSPLQRFTTYVIPLRILQLILHRFRTGSRDSACLPSFGPLSGPQSQLPPSCSGN